MADGDITVEILRGIRDELSALRGDMNQRFAETNRRIDILTEGHIRLATELRHDVHEIRGDVSILREDVSILKEDVSVLREDVSVLKEDVSVLKEDVSVLKEDVSELKEDVREIRVEQEKHGRRFEHFVGTSGEAVRDLLARVARLEDTVFRSS